MLPLCVPIGIVVASPIAFIFKSDVSTLGRLGIAAFIGAAFGGTIALVLMSLGATRPNEPMAAERGVTIRVPDDGSDASREPHTFDERQKNWP